MKITDATELTYDGQEWKQSERQNSCSRIALPYDLAATA